MADKYLGTENDSIPLMRQIARMANIEWGGFTKMVLVPSIDDMPRLFTEGYLSPIGGEQLAQVKLEAERVEGIIVDTSTMQNEGWRTREPLPICVGCIVKIIGGEDRILIGRDAKVLEFRDDQVRVLIDSDIYWFYRRELIRVKT